MNEQSTGLSNKGVVLFFVAVLAISIVGFAVGSQQERAPDTPDTEVAMADVEGTTPARSYKDLGSQPWNKGTTPQNMLDAWHPSAPDQKSPPLSAEEAELAMNSRAARRAYAGAPPMVPHGIKQGGDIECNVCHGKGVVVASRRAPAMSHDFMPNCTQCHAPIEGSIPFTLVIDPVVAPNTFVGSAEAGPGARAYKGAPPVVPHTTHMREKCGSCHGELGSVPYKTTHPERQSCLQCHGVSAELDGRKMPGRNGLD
jgi:cytochrome c-type protein NapB